MNFYSLKYDKDSEKSSKNASSKIVAGNTRTSARLSDVSRTATNPFIDVDSPSLLYDLNSVRLRRYLLEDVMFIQPPERILILVDRLHRDFCYWDKLVFE